MSKEVVFSEFELLEMGIKFEDEETYNSANCTGKNDEEMVVKVIEKKCRGTVVKKVVKPTGEGKIKVTMHCPWDVYTKMYGMNLDTLIDGVKGYGRNSRHKGFSVTQHVLDEDGNEKFKAYPNCVLEAGIKRSIENGAEEVAEIELEISVQPDEYGQGLYEALASELQDESVKAKWMTEFTPELVQVESA